MSELSDIGDAMYQKGYQAGRRDEREALKKQGKRVHRGQLFDQWGAIPSGWIVHIPEAEA